MQSAVDPQQAQRHWLDAVARSLDDFMRSPAFLELMKQNLKTVTDVKGLQNQVTQGTAHELGMPVTGDIAGLFERLQSTEHRILDRLRAIEDRLKAIESKQR
jgi:phage tail tape-measure protein